MMIETKRRGRMFFLAFGCLALAASGAIAKQGIDEGRLKILAKTLTNTWSRKSSLEEFFISRNGKPVLHKAFDLARSRRRFRWRRVFIASPSN